jgi:ComF family protein
MYNNIIAYLSNLLSPPTCVECHAFLQERVPLCATCEDALEPIVSCEVLITEKYSMKVFAVGDYHGVLRSLIMAKQFGHRLPSKQLGQLMAARCLCDWKQCDFLIPIPLHWQRYAFRGFNQAQEIAKVLSRTHGIPVSCGVQRVRATEYQASLEHDARQKNVKDVFEVTHAMRSLYRDKHVVIIDDVMTTGATLRAVARLLVDCRPASITAVVAARVVLK